MLSLVRGWVVIASGLLVALGASNTAIAQRGPRLARALPIRRVLPTNTDIVKDTFSPADRSVQVPGRFAEQKKASPQQKSILNEIEVSQNASLPRVTVPHRLISEQPIRKHRQFVPREEPAPREQFLPHEQFLSAESSPPVERFVRHEPFDPRRFQPHEMTPNYGVSPAFPSDLMQPSSEYLQQPSQDPQSFIRTLQQPAAQRGSDQYGEEPVDNSFQFLRRQTVLLNTGEMQFDYGITYSLSEFDFPTLVAPNTIGRADLVQRQLIVPFSVRYGWSPYTQLYANVPVGWAQTDLSSAFTSLSDSYGGIGDMQLGLSHLLYQGNYCSPDVILTLQTTLPTGNRIQPFVNATESSLGNGVWAASAQVLFVQTYDPIVLFWGTGYRHQFEQDFGANQIELGHQIVYQLGVGFAVNDRVTLSTALLGLFQTKTRFNGVSLPDSEQEPLRMRFSATLWRNCRIAEPFAEVGMTQTAPSARVGIVWTL